MRALTTTAILAGLVTLMAGCSSTPASAPAAEAPKAEATAPQAQAAATTPAPAPVATTVPPYLDPKNPIATERSVYFDFDRSDVKSKFTPLLERQAKYLVSAPQVKVRVEGNTDERGSAEYNLALGQRRADAVAKSLRTLGVKDSQVEAVSWGKEKPVAAGHNESAWVQNRRADIVYPSH